MRALVFPLLFGLAVWVGLSFAETEVEIIRPCRKKSPGRKSNSCTTSDKELEFRVAYTEDDEEIEEDEDEDEFLLTNDDFASTPPILQFFLDGHLIRSFPVDKLKHKKDRPQKYRYLRLSIENLAYGDHRCVVKIVSSKNKHRVFSMDELGFKVLQRFEVGESGQVTRITGEPNLSTHFETTPTAAPFDEESTVRILYPRPNTWVSDHTIVAYFRLDATKGKPIGTPGLSIDGKEYSISSDKLKRYRGFISIEMDPSKLERNLEAKEHNVTAYMIDSNTKSRIGFHSIKFYVKINPRYSAHASVFTKQECKSIIKLAKKYGFKDAAIGESNNGDGSPDQSYRRAKVSFLDMAQNDTQWLYEHLEYLGSAINNVNWRFKLGPSVKLKDNISTMPCRMMETIQIMRYSAKDRGHYDLHIDNGLYTATAFRKLSLTVQLSAASAYDGGTLQLHYGREPEVMPTEQGTGVLFPSYVLHRVSPVERGTRYALVVWYRGCESYE